MSDVRDRAAANEVRVDVQPTGVGAAAPSGRRFPCGQCGAKLIYSPGTATLRCEYCGHSNQIPQSEDQIRELDFQEALAELAGKSESRAEQVVKCTACAAEVTKPASVAALACPFCGTEIVGVGIERRLIAPKALLPFRITADAARAQFRTWLRKLWFAPTKLRRHSGSDARLRGMYIPYWTYDSDTTSFYRGLRGDDYYVTESYSTTENGKSVTRTRQVRRTRWTPVSGTVWNEFDDVLVIASKSLPRPMALALDPWDLRELTPYSPEFLSGFEAEHYQVELAEGFAEARGVMDERIRESVRRDIGGDHQQIESVRTQYNNITFKHVLLPIWISAYRYGPRSFRFLVNGRTGEVQGERPWSWVKIAATAIAVALAIALAAWYFSSQ